MPLLFVIFLVLACFLAAVCAFAARMRSRARTDIIFRHIGLIVRQDQYRDDKNEHDGKALIRWAKNRHGPTGPSYLYFHKSIARFEPMAPGPQEVWMITPHDDRTRPTVTLKSLKLDGDEGRGRRRRRGRGRA